MRRRRVRPTTLAALVCGLALVCAGHVVRASQQQWGARLAAGFQALAANQLDDALRIFDEVAAATLGGTDLSSLAEARRGQARVAFARNDLPRAHAGFADALTMFETIRDFKGIGRVRTDLGFAAWRRGDTESVIREYAAAAEAYEQAGLPLEQAGALRNMTFAVMPAGQKFAALEKARHLAAKGGDGRLQGLILHALGDLYFGVPDLQRAQELLEEAEPLLAPANDDAFARLLTSLGRQKRVHGDPAGAIPYYTRAADIQRAAQNWLGLSQTEDAIAVALAWQGHHAEALAAAERGLAYATRAGAREGAIHLRRLRVAGVAIQAGDMARADELANLVAPGDAPELRELEISQALLRADMARRRGQWAPAHQQIDTGSALLVPGRHWDYDVRLRALRSDVYADQGNLSRAVETSLEVIAAIDAVRGRLVISDDFRVAFSDGYRSFYSTAIDRLTRTGRHAEAFEVAERGRARALLDLKTRRGASLPVTEGEHGRALDGIPPETTVLSYWVAPTRTYVWVARRGALVAAHQLAVSSSALSAQISTATSWTSMPGRTAVSTRSDAQLRFDADPRPSLRTMYGRLIAPIRTHLPSTSDQTLVVIPDGSLLGLSFAELLSPSGRYLLEDLTLHYTPSVALLSGSSAVAGGSGSMLVSVSTGHPKWSSATLPTLPGTHREVTRLATTLQLPADAVIRDDAATEARMRDVMPAARLLHFATHALISDAEPAESFIALRPHGGDDGRLTATEIAGMQLSAELVVLSTCRGAAGRPTGEGMLGLTRALLGAGARTVVASVRDLPDEIATDLIPRFYAGWTKSSDPARALRQAQLQLLRRLRAGEVRISSPFGEVTLPEHPSLWAGFITVGER